ncbi:MAG TPA: hypothetical protein DCL60_08655 [Armatimonadetes bacterium]|nr:hypothetical protein [Armatimonadota bacterium]
MSIGARCIRFIDFPGNRNLKLLALATFFLMFGFGAYSATYNNFIVQVLHLQPEQLGVVESLREVPGLIMVLVLAMTMRVAEPVVAAVSLFLVAAGISAYYAINSLATLYIFSFIWSLGLHSWMTVNPSMVMGLSEEGSKGRRLGQLAAVSSFGMICGMLLVLFLGGILGFRIIFLVGGVSSVAAMVFVSMISRDIGHAKKPRMVWKRKYSLYYLITFLEGCRKQVFLTFAVFALVRNYHTPVKIVALLMIINSLVNVLFSARVGRLIDRIGEKRVLFFCYAALIPVFLGYALVRQPFYLYILYVLDNLFFLGSIGLTTYLQKIALPEDLMPSLAMGVSMNHAAAVVVPLAGGYLWQNLGYPVTFMGGAVVVAVSAAAVLLMKTPKKPHHRSG